MASMSQICFIKAAEASWLGASVLTVVGAASVGFWFLASSLENPRLWWRRYQLWLYSTALCIEGVVALRVAGENVGGGRQG